VVGPRKQGLTACFDHILQALIVASSAFRILADGMNGIVNAIPIEYWR
jgi:hypothetical protein